MLWTVKFKFTLQFKTIIDFFKLYQEKHETCTRQVLDCQNQYPGLTVYTENIIAGKTTLKMGVDNPKCDDIFETTELSYIN
mgnify:CR=1 FL=1